MRFFSAIILLLGFSAVAFALPPVQTINNPYSGYPDFITKIDTTSIQAGGGVTVTTTTTGVIITSSGGGGGFISTSTAYIQNTYTPTTATQVFNVQAGSFSVVGFGMVDTNGCLWNTSILTTGALLTTFVSCPATPSTFRPCSRGIPLGLLLSITCP